MGYNTKKILFDITSNTNPIPQYFGQLDDNFEPQLGIDGASLLSKGRAYQVGANATTTSIPILTFMGLGVSFTSSIQAKLVGSSFKTIIGSQYCEANVIAVSSSGTLTLDSALPSAPNSGTYFILEAPEQTQLAGGLVTLANGATATGAQSAQSISGAYSLLRLNVWATGTSPTFDVQIQGLMYDGTWYTLQASNSITAATVGMDITSTGIYDFDISSFVQVRMNVESISGTSAAVSAQGGLHQ